MRVLLALLAAIPLALAGCSSTGDELGAGSLETPTCAMPCLTDAVDVVLGGCDLVIVTLSLYEEVYDLPEGYEPRPPPLLTTQPGAAQMAHLDLWECQESTIEGFPAGPTTFGAISVIIEDPRVGAHADGHLFTLQQLATGPLIPILAARGFPVAEMPAEVSVDGMGRRGTLPGLGLAADVEHGPMQPGSMTFESAHHTPGAWFEVTPECDESTVFSSVAMVRPGSSVLREAAGESGVLRGGGTQRSGCVLSLDFEAAA